MDDLEKDRAERDGKPEFQNRVAAAAEAAIIGTEWNGQLLNPWKKFHVTAADALGLKAFKTASFMEALAEMEQVNLERKALLEAGKTEEELDAEGIKFDDAKLLYPGVSWDCGVVVWLRSVKGSAVLRATRDVTWGCDQVSKFIDSQDIMLGTPAFSSALAVLGQSLTETVLLMVRYKRADGEPTDQPAASGN